MLVSEADRLSKLESDVQLIASIRDVLASQQSQSFSRDSARAAWSAQQQEQLEKHDVPERDNETKEEILERERKKRKEVETSARIVTLKLQQTTDELERVRETKRNLLVGTLELKNQMQGYESTISEYSNQIQRLQKENESFAGELEKFRLERETQGRHIDSLNKEISRLNESCRNQENQLKSLGCELQNYNHSEGQLRRALIQLNDLQIQRDRNQSEAENYRELLRKLRDEHEAKENNLQEMERARVLSVSERDRMISSLSNKLLEEKQLVSSAIKLVSRTKRLIFSLQEEKRKVQEELTATIEKSGCVKKEERLRREVKLLKEKLARLCGVKDELEEALHAKDRLDKAVVSLEKKLERLECLLDIQQKKGIDQNAEHENEVQRLRTEMDKISDNFRILQKVSEDQGRTIAKQRSEIESRDELRFRVENELRESIETGKALEKVLRAEQDERRCIEKHAGRLEKELQMLQQEVEGHECSGEVQESWTQRLEFLEKREEDGERKRRALVKDRDAAMAAARRAVRQAEELKEQYEVKESKLKTSFAGELSSLEKEKFDSIKDMNRKVQELETELTRVKQLYGQMQRQLGSKVGHLQALLTACVAGQGQLTPNLFNMDFVHSNCNPGIPPFL